MKKVLAGLMAGTMVLSLAACGSGSDSKETKAPETKGETQAQGETQGETQAQSVAGGNAEEAELLFCWWGNQARTENTNAALAAYTEKNPGVKIEGMPYQWSDYWTVMATNAAGNALPDLMQQDYAYVEQYVASGDLLDLTPYIESGALDVSKIEQNILNTGMVDGKVYALCAGVNAPSMVYNKTLTDSLGIEVPDNMTMEQFKEIGKKIYDETGVRTQYGYGNSENPLTYYVRSKGYSSFWDDTKLGYEDASVMDDYYQFLIDGVADGWLMDTTTYSDVDTTSVEQNPLIYWTSENTQAWNNNCFSNMIAAFRNAAPEGVELGITCWPSDDPAASNYLKPSQFFSITTDTKNADASVAVLNYLINDLDANELLKGERGIPANTDVAAAMSEELGADIVAYLNDVVAPNCSDIFPPLPAKSSEVVNTVIQDLSEKALYGSGITAQEASEELFTKANEILGQ